MSQPSSRLSADLQRAYATLATDPKAAEAQAKAILKYAPNNPPAEMIRAGARRRQGLAAEVRSRLTALAKAHPNDANMQHELGEALAALGQSGQAIAALRRAVTIRPGMSPAWRTLADQLFRSGDAAAANDAYRRYLGAPLAEPWLAQAAGAIRDGRAPVAIPLLQGHLRKFPGDVVALAMLADAHLRQEQFAQAEPLLLACVERHPDHNAARHGLAYARIRQEKMLAEVVVDLERLAGSEPVNVDALELLAHALSQVGDHARALDCYERLRGVRESDPKFWCSYALELKFVGRRRDCEAALRQALAVSPAHGNAWFELSNLKTYAFSDDEQAALRGHLDRAVAGSRERILMHYALAKAREDAGDHADAFSNYAAGAKLRRTLLPYDGAALPALAKRSKALFTPAFFAARADRGVPDHAPIFIVGLPRSGSTLLEQILAGHADVEGTTELVYINELAQRMKTEFPDAGYPDLLALLSASDCAALGQEYLTLAATHRKLDRPFFIDKMPLNFQHLGLIHLLLPNARIVDIRRHPMASGFAAFKQYFGRGWAFSYDLADIGEYYRGYVEMMSVIDRALPGRVHRVIYEDLVDNTEFEVRRVLAYCGLPFDAACLRFHETERAVMTPSAEQVRRPMSREGLHQWREYEPWLGPLKAALGEVLETWRGSETRQAASSASNTSLG